MEKKRGKKKSSAFITKFLKKRLSTRTKSICSLQTCIDVRFALSLHIICASLRQVNVVARYKQHVRTCCKLNSQACEVVSVVLSLNTGSVHLFIHNVLCIYMDIQQQVKLKKMFTFGELNFAWVYLKIPLKLKYLLKFRCLYCIKRPKESPFL